MPGGTLPGGHGAARDREPGGSCPGWRRPRPGARGPWGRMRRRRRSRRRPGFPGRRRRAGAPAHRSRWSRSAARCTSAAAARRSRSGRSGSRRRRTCARPTWSGSRPGRSGRSPAGAGPTSVWLICWRTSSSDEVTAGVTFCDLDHVIAGVALERAHQRVRLRAEDLRRRAPARTGPRPRPGAGRRSTWSPRRPSTSSPPALNDLSESSFCSAASAACASACSLVRITRTSRDSGCSNCVMLAS